VTFQKAAALADLPVGGSLAVEIDGLEIVLVRDSDEVYALRDECSHAAVPLSEGDVTVSGGSCEIECWLHGSTFDVRTGKPMNLPAIEPVPTYPTRVEGDTVLVDL
jgi:3-phenylpropionate/trans-cinnamate dioxygenase ferredoxin subunit